MKVGIITIHNSTSYGACLQTYALWKYITNQGNDCQVIDLRRPVHKDYEKSKKYRPLRYKSPSLKSRIIGNIFEIFNLKEIISRKKREKKFNVFNSQISLSTRFCSVDDIYANPPLYDIYITGSDQVWNPYQPFCMEPYFLDFVKDTKSKKVSYASSVGLTELADEDKKLFSKWLQSYNAISVREKEAKTLITSFCNKPVKIVLDPTFLLSKQEWEQQASNVKSDFPYILLFSLNGDADLALLALQFAKKHNKRVIAIGGCPNDSKNIEYISDAGPAEFLTLIKDADTVFTDSFHGTVFSIILEVKSFFTYIAKGNKRGNRLTHLLNIFGLEKHLISANNISVHNIGENIIIDRGILNKKIEMLRQESIEFLNNALYE